MATSSRVFISAGTGTGTVTDTVFTVADNDLMVYGASQGNETVRISSGITNTVLDANIERVELNKALAGYKFVSVAGAGLQILNVSDSKVVATIPNINQTVKVAFTDGSALLTQTSSTGFALNTVPLTVGVVVTAATTPVLADANALLKTPGEYTTIAAPVKSITYSAATFFEAVANNGSIAGSITLTLANDTYTGTDGSDLMGVIVTGLPTALTSVVKKTSDTVATVTLDGTATAHANANDISNLTITLGNTAFTGNAAAEVTNATKSNLGINFADPTVSLTGATTVNEGGAIIYTATLSSAAATALSIPYALSGDKITTADFTGVTSLTTGTIAIAANATTGTLTLNVAADTTTEGVENLTVALTAPASGATLGAASSVSVVTAIADTSLTIPTISLSGATTVNEGGTITYTATLSSATATALSIPYALSGANITTTDFTGVTSLTTGTINIAASQTTGTLTLNLAADNTTESAESLTVTLAAPASGATLGAVSSVVTTIADTSITPAAVTDPLEAASDAAYADALAAAADAATKATAYSAAAAAETAAKTLAAATDASALLVTKTAAATALTNATTLAIATAAALATATTQLNADAAAGNLAAVTNGQSDVAVKQAADNEAQAAKTAAVTALTTATANYDAAVAADIALTTATATTATALTTANTAATNALAKAALDVTAANAFKASTVATSSTSDDEAGNTAVSDAAANLAAVNATKAITQTVIDAQAAAAVEAAKVVTATAALATYTTAATAYITALATYTVATTIAATKAAAVTNVATANESVTAAQAVSTAATALKAAAVAEKAAAAALKTATDATAVTTDDAIATAAVVSSTANDTAAALHVTTAATAVTTAQAIPATYAPQSFTLTTSATSVTEGNSVTFTVTPSVISATAQTLNYQVSGAVGAQVLEASSADFTTLAGTVIVPANVASATFTVTTANDNLVEGPEGFKVTLLDSNSNTVAASSTIVINDTAPLVPTITLSGATNVSEGGQITYTATLSSAAPAGGLSIPYALSGTGITAADFGLAALTGNIPVAAGATTGSLILTVAADTTTEGVEDLTVALTTPAGLPLTGTGSSVVTAIADTSTPPATTPDTTAPLFASATVNGTSLVLTYTEAMTLDATNIPASSAFTVSNNTVTGVSVDASAKTVTLTLGTAVVQGATVTVGYTDPTENNDELAIQDAAGNDASSLTSQAVVNNTPAAADTTAPTASVTAATIANTGNAVVQSTEVGTAYLVKSTLTQPTTAAEAVSLNTANDTSVNTVSIATAATNTNLAATGLIDGTYNVYTVDAAGNLSVASTNSVIVDTTAPTLTVAANQAIKNTASAVILSSEVGTAYLIKSTSPQPTTKIAADGLVAAAAVATNPLNAVSGSVNVANTNTDILATGLIDGLYKVYAVDAAGNLSTVAANTIKVDTTAPSATSVANTDTGGDSIGVYAVSDKITITFSEPVNTTTLTINDLAISNSHILGTGASLSAVSPVNGFATSFDITLGTNPTLAAYDTISVASSKAVDAVSNANSGTVDFTVPFIGPVISSASSQPVVTDGNDIFNILINSSYSASIAGFNIGDQLVFPPSTVLAFSNGAEPDSKFTFTATYLSANVATIDLIELNDGLDVVTDYASFINKFGQLSIIGAVIPEVSAA